MKRTTIVARWPWAGAFPLSAFRGGRPLGEIRILTSVSGRTRRR